MCPTTHPIATHAAVDTPPPRYLSSTYPAASNRNTDSMANFLKTVSSAITALLECMLVYMCVSPLKITTETLFRSRWTPTIPRHRFHFTPLCMYYLFNQLRISKSELESNLGKGLKDRLACARASSLCPDAPKPYFSQPIFCCSRAAQRAALSQRNNDSMAPQLAAAHRNDGKRAFAQFSIAGFGSHLTPSGLRSPPCALFPRHLPTGSPRNHKHI